MKRSTVFFIMSSLLLLSAVAFAAPVAYITSPFDNTLYLIDTSSNTVEKTIPMNYTCTANPIAVNRAGTRVYVPCAYFVDVIDTMTYSIMGQVPIGPGGAGVAVTPNGSEVYVATDSENVYVIGTASNTVVTTIFLGEGQVGVAVEPEGDRAYAAVPRYPYGNVAVIDTSSHTVTEMIQVGGDRPYGVAVAPDGRRVYVTITGDNIVSVIDTTLMTVTASVPVGQMPKGVAISPGGSVVYVTNSGDGSVSVIDTVANTVIATISIDGSPNGIGVTPDGSKVYVAVHNNGGGFVSVIDTASFSEIAKVPVGFYPMAFGEFIGGNAPPLQNLTVAINGDGSGTVTSTDSSITCGSDCSEDYWAGTSISLLAEPATCRQFTGWSGACTGSNPVCEFVLTADATATATFVGGVGLPSYNLTVTKSGEGDGIVMSTPPGVTCGANCTAPFLCTDWIRLEATPDSESSFIGWSGACSGTSNTCDLLLKGETTTTATFFKDRAIADYFPLVPGTTWKYLLDRQEEVTRRVLDKKVNVNGIDTSAVQYVEEHLKTYFTNDSNGILLHRQYQPNVAIQGRLINIDSTFNPPVKFADPIVGIGDSFDSQGTAITKAAGRTFNFGYSANTTIEGIENITVPAGNFDTMRARMTITLNSAYGDFTVVSTLNVAEGIGIVKDVSADTQGVTSTAELVYTNAGIYDLAITGITPPKKVTLSSGVPSKTSLLKLKLQNRGPFEETIEGASMLTNLITLTAESLGSCPAPSPTLHAGKPQKSFPITLKPGKTLTVYYDVTFDCANEPARGTPDYRFSAVVNRAAIDGKEDINPLDDVCPRSGTPPTDKGCGAKKPDGSLGGDILTDVVVK